MTNKITEIIVIIEIWLLKTKERLDEKWMDAIVYLSYQNLESERSFHKMEDRRLGVEGHADIIPWNFVLGHCK